MTSENRDKIIKLLAILFFIALNLCVQLALAANALRTNLTEFLHLA